ncbi:MAG: choice-of-anchor tandem repeat NxxGxxAF-containing protein [Acidobacteriota bacterium]
MNRTLSRLGFTCAAAIAVFVGMVSAPAVRAEVSVEIRTVALTDDLAPGTGGATFDTFEWPMVTRFGSVVINATLVGPGVDQSNNHGAWVETDGTLELILREGDESPGVQDGTFSGLGLSILNDAQQMKVGGVLAGPGVDFTNDQGLWAGSRATLSLIAREGDTPPDETGMPSSGDLKFSHTFRGRLDGAGRVTFFAEVLGENPDGTIVNENNENDGGIWAEKVEPDGRLTLVLVAREGQSAPITGGKLFCGINGSFFGSSSGGKIAFLASLNEPEDPAGTTRPPCDANPGILHAIWTWAEGDLGLLRRTGDPAPDQEGLPLPGVSFSGSFSHVTLNRFDRAAFKGELTGQGVDTTNFSGLWAETPEDILALVARGGDPAPDTEAGIFFDRFVIILHSGSGDVTFFAKLVGDGVDSANDQGIWAGAWDAETGSHIFRLVAREGDPAPGRGNVFDAFDRIAFNNVGQVVFRGRVAGRGPGHRIGLFAEDPFAGNLNLIVLTDDDLEVRPGDFRRVVRLDPLNYGGTGEFGQNNYLSDLGEVVFRATFTDGSQGVFVATFVDEGSSTGGGGKGGGGKGGGKPPKQ